MALLSSVAVKSASTQYFSCTRFFFALHQAATPLARGMPWSKRYVAGAADEGKSVRQESLREVQDRSPQRRCASDLREPPSQAATRLERRIFLGE